MLNTVESHFHCLFKDMGLHVLDESNAEEDFQQLLNSSLVQQVKALQMSQTPFQIVISRHSTDTKACSFHSLLTKCDLVTWQPCLIEI